jgi:hypothetical protein
LTLDEMVQKEHEAGVLFGPFHQQWIKRQTPEKVLRDLEMARRHPNLIMARQGFSSMDTNDANTASFAAQNTSAAELNMIGNTQAIINQYCAIPPNDARAGKGYNLQMGGTYGNTGTPTMIFTPRWGTSTTPATNISLGPSITYTSITGTTGLAYFIDFVFTIRTAPPGATLGTGVGTGTVDLQIPTATIGVVALAIGNTIATIDTTGQGAAGCGLTMNLTWSASSASNTSTCLWWILRSLN